MKDKKEELISEFIKLRGYYFNCCNEKLDCFFKKYKNHQLQNVVLKYINTSFKNIFETAEIAINEFVKNEK